ncbi:MAG: ABC transporter ATP-binding protein [Candidatus Hydrogenedentes bacterium]|nr:ABC transporter ATP-binding protein [Candidatus Hydrogenedentota bacterium]
MTDTAISIELLCKSFPNFSLDAINMTVPRGAIYGFIGPNGAGKTTTIDLILGMGNKDGGSIRVFGMDHLKEEVAIKRQIGYVSPDLDFHAWGRVGRAVKFYRSFFPDWDDRYCEELMARLKIGARDKIATLSFGAKTKLSLILALSHRPALLLLDEPLAGLDAIAKKDIFTELLEAVQDEARTVLISSHNLDDIERFTDHLGIIHNGKMILEGPTSELVERFTLVDCVLPSGQAYSQGDGIYLQNREDGRFRFLVDQSADALNRLRDRGAEEITTTPVTLEELFVGLVKGH